MSFMTPILMVPSVYCACAPGHPRATASAVRLMSRFIGVSPLRRLGVGPYPQIVMEFFARLNTRAERLYRPLALRRRSAADFPLPVLHGRASLVVVYRWTIRGAGRGQRLRSAIRLKLSRQYDPAAWFHAAKPDNTN